MPFGLEASVSYGGGTAQGPAAIIKASHQVELFDEEFWCEPVRDFGVVTLVEKPIAGKIETALSELERITGKHYQGRLSGAIAKDGFFPTDNTEVLILSEIRIANETY